MKIYHVDKNNCDKNKCTPVWWRLPRLKVPNCSLASPQLRYKISLIHIEHPVQSCTIYLLPRARVLCSIICINQIFWHFYEYCTYNAYCSTFILYLISGYEYMKLIRNTQVRNTFHLYFKSIFQTRNQHWNPDHVLR